MKKVLENKIAIIIFMAPAVILFIMIIFIPIIMSGYYSMTEWNGLGEKVFIGFENYKELFTFQDGLFGRSIWNSLLIGFASLLIQLPIGLILAFVLAKGIKGYNVYLTVYFMPVLVSSVAIAQLWIKIYNPDYGLLNVILTQSGLENWARAWLGDKEVAMYCAIIPIVWQYIGYYMLLFYSAIKSISTDILEAAKLDGATYVQACMKIILPLIKPMIRTAMLFSIIGSLKIFDMIYVLTNGGPSHATEVPSTLMVWVIFKRMDYGFGSAMAIFIIIECFVAMLILNALFKVNKEDSM